MIFKKKDIKIRAVNVIVASFVFFSFQYAYGVGMSSSNYQIPTQSLNSGGVDNSVSSNYGLLDTVGEVATGISSSSNYVLSAGYRQLNTHYISISMESDVSLPNLSGLLGGVGTASSTWTVITDNLAGYTLTIKADTSPALASPSDSFADYAPSGASPDYDFIFDSTESVFGFSPEGVDIIQRYKNSGSVCDTGSSDDSLKCWDGFDTSDKTIAESNSSNHPNGEQTTVRYSAGIGSSRIQESGAYSAIITVTATAL